MQAPKKAAPVRETLRAKAKLTVEPLAAPKADEAAIQEGRRAITARRKDATEIRKRAMDLYGISETGFAPLAPIEKQFKFAAAETDAELQYLQAELLVDQAAGMLESCMAIRAERDALQVEAWKSQLELSSYFRRSAIEDQARESGAITLPYERAVLESAAEYGAEEYQKNAEQQLSGLMDDLVASGFNKRMSARELAAWIAPYPLKDTELRGDDASYTFDGSRRSKPDHLFEAARAEADEAAWEQVYMLMSQRFSVMAQSEAARLRKESLALESKWRLANIVFDGERAAAERDLGWEKVFQAQSADSILNYKQRVAQLDQRFAVEFRDAIARLTAARRGLKELYDYAPAFPEEGKPGYVDEVVSWTRQAKTRVAQAGQLDQNYVFALSLKDVTHSGWESGLSSSQWTFDMSAELFPGQTQVRLRGLSLAVVLDNSDTQPGGKAAPSKKAPVAKPGGFWSARVSVPQAGTLVTSAGTTRDLDQKSIPVCHLGKIADRDAAQQPEVAGANVLYNASPIGKGWKIVLSQKSTDGTPTDTLQDVELHLHLAVRGVNI